MESIPKVARFLLVAEKAGLDAERRLGPDLAVAKVAQLQKRPPALVQ